MDVSSPKKFVQDKKNLATGQVVFESNQEVNAECACDETTLKNHEIMGNHKSIEVCNGSPNNHEPEDLTGMISSPRKTASEHEHGMEEIQPTKLDGSKCSSVEQIEANQENETNKLSQSGNQKKRGRPRKRERMVTGSPRVLRSRSQEKPKVPAEPISAPAQDAESEEKKRRKTKKIKKDQNNEFSKIKTHLRYLLSRMSYEQNYIEAYAGEGWKGQSSDKIKPEKELERARKDINRYKLKIRDLFQRIDSSLEEGKIPESLYDSEGLIDSEDIFCAKCGQTEVQLDNDIILCDGNCERGFHQFCLNPPLLKEQVPPGDEGWLCPACDCKVDCIDLINDSQGTDLSIGDSWEKVFPETAASGNKLDDTLGLPSDDSEDDDYNPDGPEVEKVEEEADGEEESSSDESESESDFSSASEDLGAVANKEHSPGLPSEDSEDDDFNPDRIDSDEQAKTKSSSSDFTSDSEDFDDINKNGVTSPEEEVQGSLMSEDNEEIPKASMEDDDYGPITAKRQVARLDYKKLHDEAYGNASSDSSDEEFLDTEAPKRRKNTKGAKDMDSNQQQKKSISTPIKRTNKKLDVEGTSNSPAPGSSDKSGTKSSYKRLGEAATERLYQSFKENQYPDRNARENLANELNLTHTQVSKWFENARWSFNHPGKRNSKIVKSQPEPTTNTATENTADQKTVEKKQPNKEKSNETKSTPVKSRKRKGKTDDNESEITPSLKDGSSNRRSGRVQAKRS